MFSGSACVLPRRTSNTRMPLEEFKVRKMDTRCGVYRRAGGLQAGEPWVPRVGTHDAPSCDDDLACMLNSAFAGRLPRPGVLNADRNVDIMYATQCNVAKHTLPAAAGMAHSSITTLQTAAGRQQASGLVAAANSIAQKHRCALQSGADRGSRATRSAAAIG
jgi:hypothetical protein